MWLHSEPKGPLKQWFWSYGSTVGGGVRPGAVVALSNGLGTPVERDLLDTGHAGFELYRAELLGLKKRR